MLKVVLASGLYSTHVLKRAITVCFLLCHEMSELLGKKQKPVVD